MNEGKKEKKSKGVNKAKAKRSITFQDYKDTLSTGMRQMRNMSQEAINMKSSQELSVR